MASFNTGVHASEVIEESDKSYFVVCMRGGDEVPYHLSKRMTEWKLLPGDDEPTLFARTWYAKRVGLAS